MKIWHVGAAPNPFRVDGVSRTVWLMGLEQARLGHDVSLLLDDAPTPEAISMAADAGLKLLDVTATPLSYARNVRDMLSTVAPQVVHMHSVFIPRQAALAKLLREVGIPYIITPHAGLAPQVLARGRLKKTIYSVLRERPRFMGSAAIALVTPAEEKAIRAYLPRYTGLVQWMPNPIEFSMLDPHRWQGVSDPKRLVFLGRFDVLVKGIDILVEIARLLPEVKVDLYGTEDPKTHDWLVKIKQNLPPNVTFNDPVFGLDKARILASASMYIQPSRWEGFPVSVAECQYLGVPSAIADTLDLSQLFHNHGLGLVISLTPELAAKQIRAALSDPQQLAEFSRRGREFALKHFAPDAVAQHHVRLYQQVIDSHQFDVTTSVPVRDAVPNAELPVHGQNGHARTHRLIPRHVTGTLKQNVSRFVERTGGMVLPGADGAHGRSVVLCYHSIRDHEHGLSVRPTAFRNQILELKELGFEFQTFAEFVRRIMRWGAPRKNVAVVTFDDGYIDNLTVAAPILSELEVPATFFVTTGLVERDPNVVDAFRKLTQLDSDYLTESQVAELHRAGFEIGAHTHSHANLSRLGTTQARWEIDHSKAVLEDAIGTRVRSFAYPFGKRHIHYTEETVGIVREAGYAGAAAVAFRSVNSYNSIKVFEIPRFFVLPADGLEQFRQKVAGYYDWLGAFQELSPKWLKSMVSPEELY